MSTSVTSTIGTSPLAEMCSTPMRSRWSFCHGVQTTSPATNVTAATTPSAIHRPLRAFAGTVQWKRSISRRSSHPTNVPRTSANPMHTALMAACAMGVRGISVGDSDSHQKSTANASATNVGRRRNMASQPSRAGVPAGPPGGAASAGAVSGVASAMSVIPAMYAVGMRDRVVRPLEHTVPETVALSPELRTSAADARFDHGRGRSQDVALGSAF